MSRYDIYTKCPLCNKTVELINGKTNSNIVMIKTKRKTTNYYHEDCIEKERKKCAEQRLTVSK